MHRKLNIGIIGDFDPELRYHIATQDALAHAATALAIAHACTWVPTQSLTDSSTARRLQEYDALWCAPGDYASNQGAWLAIQFAREQNLPFIGTCGGFQHTLIEYARNVIGIEDAQHEETSPESSALLITKLGCSLVGKEQTIKITTGSLAHNSYAQASVREQFVCNYGLNPLFRNQIEAGPLQVSGIDQNGEVRIIEIVDRSYFLATLFQPQISSQPGHPHALIIAYLKAALSACPA